MKPILIYKGDDTIFADLKKFLTFNIETNLDLTGWKAKFKLGCITKEISDISSKSFEIILSSEETKNLRLGPQSGSIVLTDSMGHIKTITNSIPFEVTTRVVENQYQENGLPTPESSGVVITLKVGSGIVTSINGKEGDVILTAEDVGALPDTTVIPDISNLATKEELQNGLNNKQDKGDYALKSEIPTDNNQLSNGAGYVTAEYHDSTKQDVIDDLDEIRSGASKGATALQSVPAEYVTETELNAKGYLTSYTETDPVYTADKPNIALKSEIPTKVSSLTNDANYQTYTDVASMIASIPQFKLSIVDSLPATGEKMTLYLVPKEGTSNDVYDEYIWIEQTSSFEHLGSTAVDLSDYYTKTETNALIPTTTSQLTNDSGFVTQNSLLEKTTETWTFTLEDGTTTTKTMVLGA